MTIPIYVASILTSNREEAWNWKKWVAYFLPVLVICFLIFRQPDLGTTFIVISISFLMLFVAGLRVSIVISLLIAGAGFIAYALTYSEYRARRLFAFMNPWADPHGSGFQVIQSFLSFHSGKIFGSGLGNGNSKLFYLPEVHTDFIFALIGEELGFVGAGAVVLVFGYLFYLLFRLCARLEDSFGSLLCFGLTLSLVLQVLINLGGVTGLLPVKGLPLPFLSWGRSALIINLFSMGILLNIIKQSEIISPAPCPKPKAKTKK